jgi:hypothetical protein
LAAAGSRHNTNEQSAATTLAGARAPADGGGERVRAHTV